MEIGAMRRVKMQYINRRMVGMGWKGKNNGDIFCIHQQQEMNSSALYAKIARGTKNG